MLDTLAKADQVKAAEANVLRFPDPTPVNHEVDPHESLDMPGMDDFDDILNALGAPSPPSENAADVPLIDDMPDLDAAPAASSLPTPETRHLDDAPLIDDMPDLDAVPAAKSPPAPETAPLDLEELSPGISATASPAAPALSGAVAEELQDEMDLNELDALLDDMLGSAPDPGLGSTSFAASESDDESAPDATTHPVAKMELALRNLDSRIASLESQQNTLHANIDKLAAKAAAKIIREELAALLKAES
jgi:hypothetical protein